MDALIRRLVAQARRESLLQEAPRKLRRGREDVVRPVSVGNAIARSQGLGGDALGQARVLPETLLSHSGGTIYRRYVQSAESFGI